MSSSASTWRQLAIALVSLTCGVSCSDPSGSVGWGRSFGGTGDDSAWKVAVDPAGDVFVSGPFEATVDFGAGPRTSAGNRDLFIGKYRGADGAHVWSRTFGAAGDDLGGQMVVDATGDVIVAGSFEATIDFGDGALASAGARDAFVTRLSGADGSAVWSVRYGGPGLDRAVAVAIGGSDLVVTGHFEDTVDFDGAPLTAAGATDMFIARLATSGFAAPTALWAIRAGGAGVDRPHGASGIGPGGEVFVTGEFAGSASFGGAVLASAGAEDVFVASYRADGSHRWSRRWGGPGSDVGWGVAADATDLWVAGVFEQTVDFGGGPSTSAGRWDGFLVAVDASMGAHVETTTFGAGQLDFAYDAHFDRDGTVWTTGCFEGAVTAGATPLTSAGAADVLLLGSAPADASTARRFGGAGWDCGNDLDSDAAGNLFLAGDFQDRIDLGDGPIASAGGSDMFLLRVPAPPP